MTTAVELLGVTRHFGAVHAVTGLDLTVPTGQAVALLGPNGAGKTTTISLLLGLYAPDSGRAELFGGTPAVAVTAGRVGAMLQDGGFPEGARVGELVEFARGLYPRPLPRAEILRVAGLTDLAGQRGDKLSGGQAQRLRFAFAFAGQPELLVLDEPTAALDVESRQAFWAAMRAYSARGATVLFSTHYLQEADENADRIVLLAAGRVVADGTGTQLKALAGGRTVAVELRGGPAAPLAELPGVVSVEVRGDRAELRTTDPDATVTGYVRRYGAVHGLAITGGLEEAFLALTSKGN